MEEDIKNQSPTVMFRGTLCIKNFVQISTIFVLFNKIEILNISVSINNTKKGRPHFGNARTRRVLWFLFHEPYM